MSDPITTLGKVLQGEAQRDAVHIAIAPVVAGEFLCPGDHVGFGADGRVFEDAEKVGIVDPFLSQDIGPGQRVWLFLYPNSVTSLRHQWTHPAFAGDDPNTSAETAEHATSREFLECFAAECELTLGDVLEAARTGHGISLGFDTPDIVYELSEEFWDHYETFTGETVSGGDRHLSIRCAC